MPTANVVISMDSEDVGPVCPGKRYVNWGSRAAIQGQGLQHLHRAERVPDEPGVSPPMTRAATG